MIFKTTKRFKGAVGGPLARGIRTERRRFSRTAWDLAGGVLAGLIMFGPGVLAYIWMDGGI